MTQSDRPRDADPSTASARWLAPRARALLTGTACAALAGCVRPAPPRLLPPLPPLTHDTGRAQPRINGSVAGEPALPQIAVSTGPGVMVAATSVGTGSSGGGSITLDFADTDIREVVAQILGNTLHLNYAIDPSVHGTATLRTVTPLGERQLIPVLQSLLAQNGATLVNNGGVYRVLPVAAAGGMVGGAGTAGGMMVPLRYASAEDLAKMLQPYVQGGARLIGIPSSNTLVIGGEPAQRDALVELVRAFDIDVLAGQSYALLPVPNGAAEDFATALNQAFRSQQGGVLASQVKVVPLARVDAVLVVTNSPRYLTDARRVYAVVERGMRQSMRTWHVYYVQNSTAMDTAYILQEAFTPNNVTAQPTAHGQGQQTGPQAGIAGTSGTSGSSGGSSGIGGSSTGSSTGGLGSASGGSSTGGLGSGGLGSGSTTGSGGQGTPSRGGGSTGANPLLGGLSSSGGSNDQNANAMRIIPNPENNAILVYATGEEEGTIEAMLHKIDILPLQVRIDAIIAEVTLNDQLQYGTEFYFKHHSITGELGQLATTIMGSATGGAGTVAAGGFTFNAAGKDGDVVLTALQGITTVKVLSSPQLLVLDNETASLQVGNLVPYLTASTTDLSASNAITNSINYQKTGVITQVTPRVNSGGLVTLDISQEVAGIAQGSTTTAASGSTINSPTFTERAVQSRVVIQDGQTVGLAGLITDNYAQGNTGIPILKDIPILNLITGTQTNTRQRTELLVLLTPHVLHDQRDARSLTEDLREQIPRAAFVPYDLQTLPRGGSDDPNERFTRRIGVGP
jgi:general secretion pathway protein D